MARPLQVYLEEAEAQRLEAWAEKRGWTKSQAVRAAVRALTHEPAQDSLLSASGMILGLPPEISESFHLALEETFVAAPKKQGRGRPAGRRLRR